MNCPVCQENKSTKPNLPFNKEHPYVQCQSCSILYQPEPCAKVYEADHEQSGDLMTDAEKTVNDNLARLLYTKSSVNYPKTLDIGAKFPYLAHCLAQYGASAYACDGISEILDFTKKHNLKVNSYQYDFEDYANNLPWGLFDFDIITLVHMAEHLYYPIKAFKRLAALMADDCLLFIRCPDYEVKGIERDFTEGHYTIHPVIWNFKSMETALNEAGLRIVETDTFYGQRDYYIRKRKPNNTQIVAGLIAKNEEDDLPVCLDSIGDQVDYIIIGDTGSTDNTKKVIKEWALVNNWQYSTCVDPLYFPEKTIVVFDNGKGSTDGQLWDFSAARNEVIRQAKKSGATWFLSMDADDKLLADNLSTLVKRNNDVYGFGIVDKEHNPNSRFIHHRLFRLDLGIKYQGAVHECIEWPKLSKVVETEHNILHTWSEHPQQEKGETRNLRIIENSYQKGDRSNRTLFYYGNILRENGHHEKAIEIYNEYLQNPVSFWAEYMFTYLYKMRCERMLNNIGAAFTTGFEALSKDQRFSEIWVELAYMYEQEGLHKKAVGMGFCAQQPVPPSLFPEFNKYKDQPHRIMSRCFEQMGDIYNAKYDVECILKHCPDDKDMQEKLKELSQELNSDILRVNRPGAAGDIIMCLVVIQQYKDENPDTIIHFYCDPAYLDLPKMCPAVAKVLPSSQFKEGINLVGYPRHEGYPHKPIQKHLIYYFADELGVVNLPESFVPILPDFPEGTKEKIITIQPFAGWSPYKEWSVEKWEQLISLIKMKFPEYAIVQLSSPREKKLEGAEKPLLSLVSAVAYIKRAALHIGIDSFGNHTTNLLPRTKSVILWGSTAPTGSGYTHNINIHKGLECSPCYKEYKHMSVDYMGECDNLVAGTHKCMYEITVGEVFNQVVNCLGRG